MSLTSEMTRVVQSIATAKAVRHRTLECIRTESLRHLSEADASLRHTAAVTHTQISESLRSLHLATAMLLGAADETIDEYRKHRQQQTRAVRNRLAIGAAALHKSVAAQLGTTLATRRKMATQMRNELAASRKSLHVTVKAMTDHLLADRIDARQIWRKRALSPKTAEKAVVPPQMQTAGPRDVPKHKAKSAEQPAQREAAEREARLRASPPRDAAPSPAAPPAPDAKPEAN
jgi:hypothetical protein